MQDPCRKSPQSMPALISRAFKRYTAGENVLFILSQQADGKRAYPGQGNSFSFLCPAMPHFRLPRSSWAHFLLRSPTVSNSLPSAPSKEVLINALHFTASQGSNGQEDYDKLFFLVSKQSGGQTACPPGAEPPCHRPTSTGHREGNKGAIFTLVIALNWWLASYNM